MTPALLRSLIVRPTLAWLGAPYDSREAEAMLLAVAQQESGCRDRCQLHGPARGWWQMEPPTAHAIIDKWPHARSFLIDFDLDQDNLDWLEFSDTAACVLARGDLWLDPYPLPDVGNQGGAWDTYARVWRPGRPRPDDWPASYAAAMQAMGVM